jgi:putative addiction module component (TIGR02574 family)
MMTKLQLKELQKLSITDKLKVMETLWDNITTEYNIENLPKEHQQTIEARLKKINSGKAKFKTWHEVQSKFLID